jgi:hypothetical protein
MLRMLNRYRNDLGVTAPSHELEAAALATEQQLRADTAAIRIADARRTGSSAMFTVVVENPPDSSRSCLNRSRRRMPRSPGRTAAWAWASRSCADLSKRMVAVWMLRALESVVAPPSRCSCQSLRDETPL